jgi:sterol desaturase/sphingolipid hydroxylase (fatty acid hydroxylase superfamily)/rhodanese-related sulfurtransferase
LDSVLAHEPDIRLLVFLGVFALIAGLEALFPRRPRAVSRWLRWPNNLAVTALNTILVRILFPTAAVGVALLGEPQGWGLIPWLALPSWAGIVMTLIVLDLAIYLQHIMFHAVPALWRLHRMHHADLDFDVTTGARFHPVEIVLSLAIKLAVILALGAPAAAVLIFEVLLNATAMFNHANLRIAPAVDRALRWLVVTPDMHRVHHSIAVHETNSNFGFNLPWWDRLFGTYRAQPADGHEGMTIGVERFRAPRELWLDRMLTQPLREDAGPYALGRRETAPPKTWIEPADLDRRSSLEAPAIVDVRSADEFAGPLGHIPGAWNIPVDDMPARLGELTALHDRSLVVVCRTDKRSARAAEMLRAAGFSQVAVLRGGMERWNAERLEVQRGDVQPERAHA